MGYMDAECVWKAAAGIEGIQPSDRLTWISLAFYRNTKTGQCFPSVDTLMEQTGLSRRGVQKCVRHLQELGVLKIVPGGGRTSNRYELLIHHIGKDNQVDIPDEELADEESTSVLSTPLQRSEYASAAYSVRPCSVVSTPESGSLTPEVETRKLNPVTVNGSSVSGQRSTVSSSDKTEDRTGETPVPPTSNDKDNDQDSGEQSPSVSEESPTIDEIVYGLMKSWMYQSTKKAHPSDFRLLLEDNGGDFGLIYAVMFWMFLKSDFWAKESPNWELGPKTFDIASSRAFRTNFLKIRDSYFSFMDKCREGQERKKRADDSGMAECMNALREQVAREKAQVVDGLEEDIFDDDDFPAASVRTPIPDDVEEL